MKQQKLYIDTQHGLGNRLRAWASAAVLAEKSGMELIVIWQPDHHCDCELSDLFDYKGKVLKKSFMTTALDDDIDIFNYMEAEPGSNKDELISISNNDLYIRSAYAINHPDTSWKEENSYLQTLVPVFEVQDLIAKFDLHNHIGVHIRMEGDSGSNAHSYEKIDNWTPEAHEQIQFWREKSHFKYFINHIDSILEEDSSLKFFLATDMAETYEIFKSTYGDRMQYLNRDLYDRSKAQLQYALADALLLSKCKRLVGSTWSSFSEIAIRFSSGYEKVEMSGTDF